MLTPTEISSFLGGIAGFISLIWLIIKDLTHFLSKPKLKINKLEKNKDLRTFEFANSDLVRRFANLHVYSSGQKSSKRCIAKMTIIEKPKGNDHLERSYNLHWADIDYSFRTTESQPVDIGTDERRLDVVFTQKNSDIPGSWIAIPIALTQPSRQAHLPPGRYVVDIQIHSDNGKNTKKRYVINSPKNWEDLDFSEER